MTKYFLILFSVVVCVIILGVLAPMLVSTKSTLAFMIGIGLCIGLFSAAVYFFKSFLMRNKQ